MNGRLDSLPHGWKHSISAFPLSWESKMGDLRSGLGRGWFEANVGT